MGKPHRRAPAPYGVGKGRTPPTTRWKPGQSGNPKGRPKGSKNAASLALAELKRKVRVTFPGNKKKQMTVMEISYRRLSDRAMAGDQKALALLLMLAEGLNVADDKAADSTLSRQRDLVIIADYLKKAKERDPK